MTFTPSQADDVREQYPELYEAYPELYHDYPEVAPDIYSKIDAHGEEWVLENWTARYAQARLILSVPDKEDLPFFDPEQHEAMSEEEKRSTHVP